MARRLYQLCAALLALAGAAAAGSGGCAGAAPSAGTTAARSASSAAGARADRAPAAWQAVVLPARGPAELVGSEPNGTQDVLAGAVRAQLGAAGEVRAAEQHPLRAVVAWARDGARWWFATGDGALWRAASFLAPLERAGETGGAALVEGFASRGVLAARGADGALWLGGPGQPDGLRRVALPGEPTVIAASFADGALGVVALSPSRLLRTLDGGATFSPVDPPLGEAPLALAPAGEGALAVRTTAGLFELASTGAPRASNSAFPEPGAVRDPAVLDAATTAARGAAGALGFATAFAARGLVLADGTLAVPWADAVLLRAPGVPGAAPRRVALPDARCGVFALGARLLARCPGARAEVSRLLVHDPTERGGEPWSALREIELAPANAPVALADADALVTDPAGATIAVHGACEPGTALEDSSVCFYDGTRWRTRVLERGAHLVALQGELLLYRGPSASGVYWAPLAADEPRGAARGERVAAPGRASELADVAFGGPRRIVGTLADRYGGARWVVSGEVGSTLRERPLPPSVRRAAFGPDGRGVAAGATLDALWTTADLGAHWRRMPLPIDGAPGETPLEPARSDALAAWCTARVCGVGLRVLWGEPAVLDAVQPRAPPLVAARTPPADRAPDWNALQARALGASGTAPPRVWSCDVPAAPSSAPAGPPAARAWFGAGGWLQWPALTNPEARAARPRWGGVDDAGPFQTRGGALAPQTELASAADDARRPVPALRLLTRDFALLERCPPESDDCELWFLARDRPPRRLARTAEYLHDGARGAALVSALPTRGGGAALLLTLSHVAPREPAADVVIVLDALGDVIARRAFGWGVDERGNTPLAPVPFRTLAIGPAGPALAMAPFASPRTWTVFTLAPTDAGSPLATVPPGALPACATPPGPGATVFIARDALVTLRAPDGTPASRALVAAPLIAVDATGACLHGVDYWSRRIDLAARPLSAAVRLRATRNTLTGTAAAPDAIAPIRCTLH